MYFILGIVIGMIIVYHNIRFQNNINEVVIQTNLIREKIDMDLAKIDPESIEGNKKVIEWTELAELEKIQKKEVTYEELEKRIQTPDIEYERTKCSYIKPIPEITFACDRLTASLVNYDNRIRSITRQSNKEQGRDEIEMNLRSPKIKPSANQNP